MTAVGLLMLSVVSASCTSSNWNREEADEARQELIEALANFRQGFRDGISDSTVIVTIGDSVTTTGYSHGRSGSLCYSYTTTAGDSLAGHGGNTYINVTMPDAKNFGSSFGDFGVPDFVPTAVVVGTIMVFGMPVLAIFLICFFIYRTKRARYQAIARIMETGREVPPGMFPQMEPHAKWDSGVRYVAWGAGLTLFFLICGDPEWAMLTTVPIFIGLGKLVAYRKEQKRVAAEQPTEPPVGNDAGEPASTPSAPDNDRPVNIPPIPPRR